MISFHLLLFKQIYETFHADESDKVPLLFICLESQCVGNLGPVA